MPLDPSSPYLAVSPSGRWREAVSDRPAGSINPHDRPFSPIAADHQVVSAGSCFAQRLSEALQAQGRAYLVTEPGPPFLDAETRRRLGYGVYSARYGNIYTALQLLQLVRRALGQFTPEEPIWRNGEGRFIDPFRPGVEASGFESESACLWDRESHLRAAQRAFEQMDVLIFTLGLTEAWLSAIDGAVFPVCPGSGLGGRFDPDRYRFHNFRAVEVVDHLDAAITLIRSFNSKVRIVLTVSPVPLIATFEPRHVLQSTIYSKSALRVACDEVARRHDRIDYFASYEIVTATGHSGAYFLPDRRTVSDEAVAHVLRCFDAQFFEGGLEQAPAAPAEWAPTPASSPMCDEDDVLRAMAS